jgi:hypothetical protein
MNENDLMSRLVASKAIMDKSNSIKRGEVRDMGGIPQAIVQNFDIPQAKYNIPQEFLQEQPSMPNMNQPYLSSLPVENTKPVGVPTVDAIKKSKLPDDIKRLMMEHPISQPQQFQTTISDELVEKASRLMKQTTENNYVPESAKPKNKPTQQSTIDYSAIQKMITEAVNNALKENGLLVESVEKSNDVFSFKVGKHIFEGKVTKIKKVS